MNEQVKYVIHGGKVQCPFASPPTANIVVVDPMRVSLQDKPMATTKDTNGKVNFNFTGVCTHPSQQKPSSPPPPCKAVISLGKWKNYSETMINDDNALLVKSTIPCNVSGQDIKIIDSGQKAELTDVKPKTKHVITPTDVYWKEDGSSKKIYTEFPNRPVTLYIETKDFSPNETITVYFTPDNGMLYAGNKDKLEVSGRVDSTGIAIVKNFKIEYEK